MRYLKSFNLFEAADPIIPKKTIEEFQNTVNNSLEGQDFLKWFNYTPVKTGRIYISIKFGIEEIYIPPRTYFEKRIYTDGEKWCFGSEFVGRRYKETIDNDLKNLLRTFIKDVLRKNRPNSFNNQQVVDYLEKEENLPLGQLPASPKEFYDTLFKEKIGKGVLPFYSIIEKDPLFNNFIDNKVLLVLEEGMGGVMMETLITESLKTRIKSIALSFGVISTLEESIYFEFLKMKVLPGEVSKKQSPKLDRNELQSKLILSNKDPKEILELIKQEYIKNILRLKVKNRRTFMNQISGVREFDQNKIYWEILSKIYQHKLLPGYKLEGIGGIEESLVLLINKNLDKLDKVELGNILKGLQKNSWVLDYNKFSSLLDPSIRPQELAKGASILKRFLDE